MKIILAAVIALGAGLAAVTPSSAMTVSRPDTPSMVQTVRDPTCNAPSRSGRCQWYGMPGVHSGPRWLRQRGGTVHRRHYKRPRHVNHRRHNTH